MGDISDVRTVVVVRATGGLGDILCAVPALRSLRVACPQAHVTFVGLPQARWVHNRFPHYVDAFVDFPGWPGLPEQPVHAEAVCAFLARMQAQRFDLALQMHGNGSNTNALVALLGARRQAGFCVPGSWRPSGAWLLPYDDREPEVRRYLRLMEHLGAPASGDALEFPLRDDDTQAIAPALRLHRLEPGGYVCIHAGASKPSHRWSAASFAAVADRVAAEGHAVVLTGTSAEAGVTEAVARRMKTRPVDLTGQTSLGGLAALLQGAALVISNDTGTVHLAAALRVPSVVIFPASETLDAADPMRWAPLDARLHRVVHEHGARPPCDVDGARTHLCVPIASPDVVWEGARALLARQPAYAP